MELPQQPVTLTPKEISDLAHLLSSMRHNVNNHLSLVTAAVELIGRRPEMISKITHNVLEQSPLIVEEIQKFSRAFEQAVGIKRNAAK